MGIESRRVKQAETQAKTMKKAEPIRQIIAQQVNPDKNKAATKTAEIFNTNRTYVSDAQKLKKESPEVVCHKSLLQTEKRDPNRKRSNPSTRGKRPPGFFVDAGTLYRLPGKPINPEKLNLSNN